MSILYRFRVIAHFSSKVTNFNGASIRGNTVMYVCQWWVAWLMQHGRCVSTSSVVDWPFRLTSERALGDRISSNRSPWARGVTKLPAASGRAHRGELWGVCPSSSLVNMSKAISGSTRPIFMIFAWIFSIRTSFFDSFRDVAMPIDFGQNLWNDLYSTHWHFKRIGISQFGFRGLLGTQVISK